MTSFVHERRTLIGLGSKSVKVSTCSSRCRSFVIEMAAEFSEDEYITALAEIIESLPHDYLQLKPEQEKALKQLVFGGDLLAVLPTGFGKSLIFQLLVLVLKRLTEKNCCVVVVCPLKSIVDDQVKEATSIGLKAKSLSDVTKCDDNLSEFDILFGSAEEVLDKKFLDIFKKQERFYEAVKAIIVDESHTVETWTGLRTSKGKKTVKPFRESFGKLSLLRSFCQPGTPIGAVTGTADQETQTSIKVSLCLKSDALTIYVSPNRSNLRFTVKKVKKKNQQKELLWLVELVKLHGITTPKTLIFCNTMNEVASVVNYLVCKLGSYLYHPQDCRIAQNSILGIYHANSWDTTKERVITSMKENGKKRIVVATTALCMGVNLPDIRYIVNWGPARTILDQHQQAGRAGRDGEVSDVLIIYHGQQISRCEKEVKNFVRSTGCLRVSAYISLDPDIQPTQPGHNCCSHCAENCKCLGDSCDFEVLPFNKLPTQETQTVQARSVTARDRQDLKEALLEVMKTMSVQTEIEPCASHGFSKELIEDVVKHCDVIFSLDDIVSRFPVFSLTNALAIFEVLQEVFLDIPFFEETLSIINQNQIVNNSSIDQFEFTEDLFEEDLCDILDDL